MRWDAAVREHGAAWNDLVDRAGLNPSLRPGWMGAVADSHGLRDRIQVVLAESEGRLTGVLPFTIETRTTLGVPVRCVELLSNHVAYHAELIADGSPAALLDLIDEAIPDWQLLHVGAVNPDCSTAVALREWADAGAGHLLCHPIDVAPFIVPSPF